MSSTNLIANSNLKISYDLLHPENSQNLKRIPPQRPNHKATNLDLSQLVSNCLATCPAMNENDDLIGVSTHNFRPRIIGTKGY